MSNSKYITSTGDIYTACTHFIQLAARYTASLLILFLQCTIDTATNPNPKAKNQEARY